jgi:carbamoyl-phosphate synthase large subunit
MDKTETFAASPATLWRWASRSSPPRAPRKLAGRRRACPPSLVAKVYEGRPNIVDRLKNNEIALVMNTTEGTGSVAQIG